MIDEARLEELLRDYRIARDYSREQVYFLHAFVEEAADTIVALWKVARAARRWHKAAPGRESIQREGELVRLIEPLPPQPR